MPWVCDRAPARKRTPVAAGKLTGVKAEGDDLALGDADLDAAADKARIERVVAGIDTHVGIGCDPHHKPPICDRWGFGKRAHPLAFLFKTLVWADAHGAVPS